VANLTKVYIRCSNSSNTRNEPYLCPHIFSNHYQQVGIKSREGKVHEICSIVGQKTVVNEVYYRVNWEPTWMPESELEGVRELIDKFIARLQPERHKGCNGYSDGGRSK
jgi:hypothetical protein